MKDLAARIHDEFRAKPGAQHIASEFSLRHLAALLDRTAPQRILEIGAGIGTATKLLLIHPRRAPVIVSTEGHPFCIDALARNLAGVDRSGWSLLPDIEAVLALGGDYDLIIFDGTLSDERQYSLLGRGTWCFVDGNRIAIREALVAHLRPRSMRLDFVEHLPGSRQMRFGWRRRRLGGWLPLPKLKIKPVKGCSIGQVMALDG